MSFVLFLARDEAILPQLLDGVVEWVERHNQSEQAIRIELWPESHLEQLLVQRPDLIAEFGLR